MKQLDLWRALGVTAGVMLVSSFLSGVIYMSGIGIETADIAGLVSGALVLAVFSYLYYKGTHIKPSVQTGFYLGCIMVGYTFLMGFINGYLAAAQGYPTSALPPPATWIIWTSLLMGFAIPMLVGKYLSKGR